MDIHTSMHDWVKGTPALGYYAGNAAEVVRNMASDVKQRVPSKRPPACSVNRKCLEPKCVYKAG